MIMQPAELVSDIDDEFSRFFRGLGYDVTWDFSRNERDCWYEILDGDRMICQVDFGVWTLEFRLLISWFDESLDDLKALLVKVSR